MYFFPRFCQKIPMNNCFLVLFFFLRFCRRICGFKGRRWRRVVGGRVVFTTAAATTSTQSSPQHSQTRVDWPFALTISVCVSFRMSKRKKLSHTTINLSCYSILRSPVTKQRKKNPFASISSQKTDWLSFFHPLFHRVAPIFLWSVHMNIPL